MIDHRQLREYVIRPVLQHIKAYSEDAEELAILTCAAESMGGRYIKQLGKGPALGIYQMEPATHDDCWGNFLRYKGVGKKDIEDFLGSLNCCDQDTLATRIRSWQIPGVYDDANYREMAGNLYYATAMMRVKYLRDPHAIPGDIEGIARYYKRVYNTELGSATVQGAIDAYRKYTSQ